MRKAAFVCSLAAGLCMAPPPSARADSGTMDIEISASAQAFPVEMEDTTVTAQGGSGTLRIANSSGRPFVDGDSAQVRYALFSRKTPSGLILEADSLATFPSEETLMLVFERGVDHPGTAGEGTMRIVGGSGRFTGVDGRCTYRTDDRADAWNVTAHCEWLYVFPYR
ncbi:MAG TPA: hypothetical protein VFV71_11010 [Burkholderiales bacterium]|nr:hypothetical protein [Burkholderiales bacterium]